MDLPVSLWPSALDRVRAAELVGSAPGHRAPVPVAADLLPGPVPDRAEDFLRRILAARAAALRTGVPVAGTRGTAGQTADGQLPVPVQRAFLRRLFVLFPQGRSRLPAPVLVPGLSDGLCDRASPPDA